MYIYMMYVCMYVYMCVYVCLMFVMLWLKEPDSSMSGSRGRGPHSRISATNHEAPPSNLEGPEALRRGL